ncbi:MAG: Rnf-Nqr domain containing protein [Oscillospiraceae bacterium]
MMNSKKDFSLLYHNWDNTVRRKKVFLSNPVFIKGLALAPLAVAATTVRNGLLLCIAVFFLLTPTRIATSFITRTMSVPLKTFFYPMISAVIFCFIYYYMYKFLGAQVLTLGVYLPILVVDPLIVKNFEKTRKESLTYSFINGMKNTAGFIVACLIISVVREFLAYGSIYGIVILKFSPLPMAQYSFGGFLIIAMISAIWTMAVNSYKHKIKVEVEHNERIAKSGN